MRHGKKFNHLGRKKAHRKAMLSNMANSLIEHKRINTTVAKAKALRVFVEPILNRAKDDSTHSRRIVFRYLGKKDSVTELFRNVGPKIMDRPGGYTRIIKTGFRKGDGADMCMIELVDFNELYTAGDGKKKKRSRRGGGKKVSNPVADVSAKATETASKVEDAASAVAEEANDAAEAVANEVAEKVEDVKAETTDKVEAVAEDAKEAADDAADNIAEESSEDDKKEGDEA